MASLSLVPRRRRRLPVHRRMSALERRTLAIGGLALGTTGAVVAGELARVWKRGSAPTPMEADHVVEAAGEAVAETVEVAIEGYRATSSRENALFNMLVSFTLTFGIVRLSTARIRARGRFGPFRDWHAKGNHVHHFVPGIALAFAAGGVSVASRNEEIDKWLAIPFGVGLGLTLDESALLLRLDDVYWSEEGIVSVQITLATIGLLSSLLLALRLLRRGERVVLADPVPEPGAPTLF